MVNLFRNINQCRHARTGRKRKRWNMSCNSQFSIYIKKKVSEGHIFKVDAKYHKHLHEWHNDLPFLPEKIRIKKCHNFLCHIYDQKKYALHIRTFKKELNHELFFKKVQKARLKPYSQVNTKLRTKRLEYIIQFLKRKD